MASKSDHPQDGAWMKLGEAAQALGVSEITLRRRVRSGRLPYDFRAGKYFVFVPHVLDRNVFLDGPGADGDRGSIGMAVPVRPTGASETVRENKPSPSARSVQPPRPGFSQEAAVSSASDAFLNGRPQTGSGSQGPRADSIERTAAAANILRPYARASESQPELRVNGPTDEQVISILKTELMEREREIAGLRKKVNQLEAHLAHLNAQFGPLQKQIADQSTLLVALEAAYNEVESSLAELTAPKHSASLQRHAEPRVG